MWRTAKGRRLLPPALVLAIAVISTLTPQGQCQTPFCQLVYYTATSTIVQTHVVTAVEQIVEGNTTTTTTKTYTTVVTIVTPGGVLANLSCSVPQPPPPTITMPKGPTLGNYPTDAFSLLMAAIAIGAVAAGIVSNLSRTVVYMFAAAAVVSTLATAYPSLAPVAQATVAITLFAAVIFLALSR